MPRHPPAHDPAEFSARLKEALTDVGQNSGRGAGVKLADRFKVSPVTASAWLKGEHMPSPNVVEEMATEYGVRYEWLYFGKGSKRAATVNVMEDRTSYGVDAGLQLTAAEYALIAKFRAADESLRQIVELALEPKQHQPSKRKLGH